MGLVPGPADGALGRLISPTSPDQTQHALVSGVVGVLI